jgi:hypothetical protein
MKRLLRQLARALFLLGAAVVVLAVVLVGNALRKTPPPAPPPAPPPVPAVAASAAAEHLAAFVRVPSVSHADGR